MTRSSYKWGRERGVVWIEDLDEHGARSVTNDVEHVIEDLVKQGVEPDAQPILYRDSTGRWDRIKTRAGRFLTFESLGGTSLADALSLMALKGSA